MTGVAKVHIIERAFELAPECGSIEELRQRLVREGYFQVRSYLAGKEINRQLHERLDPVRRKPWPSGRT
jgi:hypothetical protein